MEEQREPYRLVGNGSNLLITDDGLDEVIVTTHTGRRESLEDISIFQWGQSQTDFLIDEGYIDESETEGKTFVMAGSGCMLSKIATDAARAGLTGMEFAAGIPGTLGGAVVMNAGAYGGEIKDIICAARVMDEKGNIKILKNKNLDLSYRHSIIQEKKLLVLDALFALETSDTERIMEKIKELNVKRKEKQPLEYASAGSTFKRPDGYYAAKLIEDAGLKGYRCGDVMVSDKHCGFVVNLGRGTFAQAMDVINHVTFSVKEKFGVRLEPEVKIWT